jgi:type I restriction enzyme M protein
VQYFYAYLNPTGRAGFVMASSASDAGNKDRDIREKLVKTGHVDVMVAVGNKFFYTRSLPCTVWFFDKGKPEALQQQVLMLDARSVYTVVSARSHVFSEEQLLNLNAIVWLYRGQTAAFLDLISDYHGLAREQHGFLETALLADNQAVQQLQEKLTHFAAHARLNELNRDAEATPISEADWLAFGQAVQAPWLAVPALPSLPEATQHSSHTVLKQQQAGFEAIISPLLDVQSALEARHKTALAFLETAEKTLRGRLSKAFDGKALRELKQALQSSDPHQAPSVRDAVLLALKQTVYFIQQVQWLHQRFPEAVYADVLGLCKAVSLDDIAANDYSLTPGRYVGVAASVEAEDDFAATLRDLHVELSVLNDKAAALAGQIAANFEGLC